MVQLEPPHGVSFATYVLPVILIKVGDVFDDLLVGEVLERLLAGERQYFPQDDRERPHVAFCAQLVLRKRNSVSVGEHRGL